MNLDASKNGPTTHRTKGGQMVSVCCHTLLIVGTARDISCESHVGFHCGVVEAGGPPPTHRLAPFRSSRFYPTPADKSKFGFKMLEKMGWSDGTGLGARGNGITSHVKVRTKNNTLGVGASNKDVDYAWLETQDTFNSLLKDLNEACGTADGSMPEGPPPDSVLKDSKKNRTRGARLAMFESRFRKGKDLSLMKSEDLACILGGSSKRPERLKTKGSEDESNAGAADTSPGDGDVTGLTIIPQKASVSEYFEQKMAEKRRRQAEASANAAVSPNAADSAGPAAAVGIGSGSDTDDAAGKKAKAKSHKKVKSKKKSKVKDDTAGPKRKHEGDSDDQTSKKKKKKKHKHAGDEGQAHEDSSSTKKKKKKRKDQSVE